MMYGLAEYTSRINTLQVMPFNDLIERILMQPEGEQFLVMWATCLRQNDPGEKILRNIPPMLVHVSVKSKPNPYARYNQPETLHELVVVDNAKRSKVVKLRTNNNGDLILCDMQEEAIRYYNRIIDKYLKWTRDELKSRSAYMENRISDLSSFKIAGHIVEEVISPTCGT